MSDKKEESFESEMIIEARHLIGDMGAPSIVMSEEEWAELWRQNAMTALRKYQDSREEIIKLKKLVWLLLRQIGGEVRIDMLTPKDWVILSHPDIETGEMVFEARVKTKSSA